MIKTKFNLLPIMTMNSLNVKHQGKSSNQLEFHLSAYTHLWKLSRAIFQKHKKYKLTVWIIQSLIPMIIRKWMFWLGCTRQCKKNRKQHHIQNQSKFLPWYLINGLECTVQNILDSFNTLFELHIKSKNRWDISKTLLLKKEKLSLLKHFIWQQTFMKMTISVGKCLKRKTMLVWVKEYIIKNFASCKSLCNLQELYTAFK